MKRRKVTLGWRVHVRLPSGKSGHLGISRDSAAGRLVVGAMAADFTAPLWPRKACARSVARFAREYFSVVRRSGLRVSLVRVVRWVP